MYILTRGTVNNPTGHIFEFAVYLLPPSDPSFDSSDKRHALTDPLVSMYIGSEGSYFQRLQFIHEQQVEELYFLAVKFEGCE